MARRRASKSGMSTSSSTRRRSSSGTAVMSYAASAKLVEQRRKLALQYRATVAQFTEHRRETYEQQIQQLHSRLDKLRSGDDEQFLQMVDDLAHTRDADLVRLRLHRTFLLARGRTSFDDDMAQATQAHESTAGALNDKLVRGLETHVKKFKDDKSLWDISADDAAADLGAALGFPGITSASAPRVRGTLRQKAIANSAKHNGGGGGASGGSGSESGLRSSSRVATMAAVMQQQQTNTENGSSNIASDINSFLSEVDSDENAAQSNGRGRATRNARAVKGLAPLKSDQVSQDLVLLKKKHF